MAKNAPKTAPKNISARSKRVKAPEVVVKEVELPPPVPSLGAAVPVVAEVVVAKPIEVPVINKPLQLIINKALTLVNDAEALTKFESDDVSIELICAVRISTARDASKPARFVFTNASPRRVSQIVNESQESDDKNIYKRSSRQKRLRETGDEPTLDEITPCLEIAKKRAQADKCGQLVRMIVAKSN